ncbi:jmjC domain-containing protein 8-like isoform X2 [Dreissena polymorpha]|uniref:jmjC domain-containing protein 8-like isoform X2 n=1 Tax=Dreissena polymorpha TaxID=45954 RepID=UPI002263DB67|nr:jmjC domain-containing protein 8-like isoform X2 [Dreissena polymorpha]
MIRVNFLLATFALISYSQEEANTSQKKNGGWTTLDEERIAQPGPCNIDRVDISTMTFTQKQFIENYAYHRPVVIVKGTDNSKFHAMCEKSQLLEKYGHKVVRLSSANTYSYDKRDVELSHYVDHIMRPQTLDRLGNGKCCYNPTPYSLPNLSAMFSFGVVAAGTGVPFHFHGPGFAEVIYGRKRWFMYPPEKQPAFNPNKTTLHWLMEEYEKLHPSDMPLECTIDQGEAIYFPDRWWHGTLNIDTSVFISTFLG